jgi:hypothetical protein
MWFDAQSGLIALGHDRHHERAIFPEHIVDARLKRAQHVRLDRIETHERGRMLTGAGHALNRIVRRKSVIAEKLPDFVVGCGFFYIA